MSNAVIAAAANIDRLENIVPVVKQISHKHRSIGVKPEHYPIVGKYLLIAIKDVLKDGAAPEVIQAWEKHTASLQTLLSELRRTCMNKRKRKRRLERL